MPSPKTILEMPIEEIEKSFGVEAKQGKISKAGGDFFLSMEGKKYPLESGLTASPQVLEKLVNKDAYAVINKRGQIIIIIVRPPRPRPPCLLCYIPVPEFKVKIDSWLREQLIRKLTVQQVIPQKLGRQLLKDLTY